MLKISATPRPKKKKKKIDSAENDNLIQMRLHIYLPLKTILRIFYSYRFMIFHVNINTSNLIQIELLIYYTCKNIRKHSLLFYKFSIILQILILFQRDIFTSSEYIYIL